MLFVRLLYKTWLNYVHNLPGHSQISFAFAWIIMLVLKLLLHVLMCSALFQLNESSYISCFLFRSLSLDSTARFNWYNNLASPCNFNQFII